MQTPQALKTRPLVNSEGRILMLKSLLNGIIMNGKTEERAGSRVSAPAVSMTATDKDEDSRFQQESRNMIASRGGTSDQVPVQRKIFFTRLSNADKDSSEENSSLSSFDSLSDSSISGSSDSFSASDDDHPN
jgi:hypothetical protein